MVAPPDKDELVIVGRVRVMDNRLVDVGEGEQPEGRANVILMHEAAAVSLASIRVPAVGRVVSPVARVVPAVARVVPTVARVGWLSGFTLTQPRWLGELYPKRRHDAARPQR